MGDKTNRAIVADIGLVGDKFLYRRIMFEWQKLGGNIKDWSTELKRLVMWG